MFKIKLPDDLVELAKLRGREHQRTAAEQLEHWMKIGKLAEDNPDLPYGFIQNVLIGLEEKKAGLLEPYEFG